MIQLLNVKRALAAVVLLAVGACSSEVDEPAEPLSSLRASVINVGDHATVTPGTPSTRTASCPGGKLPDQCGTWAGVELSATHGQVGLSEQDEHCLCQPIAVQIPAALPVVRGNSGRNKAELKFRTAAGGVVTCRYQGNRKQGHSPGTSGGDLYTFERCSDGSRVGQTVQADWFSLVVEHADQTAGPTTVELRLGEPDVVGGEVQEQVFYSQDPRIPEAALHVPRGAAPAFQDFDLEVLATIPPGTTLANGGRAFTTTGLVIDAHAQGHEDFAFSPVVGAPCTRLELPYDPALLTNLAGPGSEDELMSRLILDVDDALAGLRTLQSEGDVVVDPLRHTVSVCVEHLSFRVSGIAPWNADLVGATIRQNVTGATPQDLLDTTLTELPTLRPSTSYTLTLDFTNRSTGRTWTSNTEPVLVVVSDEDTNSDVVPISSPWFGGLPFERTVFTLTPGGGGSVAPNQTARFSFSLTTPQVGAPLNLCLREGLDNYFGQCFSWDVHIPTPTAAQETAAGSTAAKLVEVCDGVNNTTGAGTDGAVVGRNTQCFSTGINNTGRCRGEWRCTTPNGPGLNGMTCIQAIGPIAESCTPAGVDDDCDGETDEVLGGPCQSCGGRLKCDGSCSIPDPANLGDDCQNCGGKVQCDGSCSINNPPGWNDPCQNCGGRVQCDGSCSINNPPGWNDPCQSCGGRVQCDLSCSINDPPWLGDDCQNCGGKLQCDGSCSINNPPSYGAACGCRGEGFTQCDGSCSIDDCRGIFFKAVNVDDQIVVADGYAVQHPPFGEGILFPPNIWPCIGNSTGSLFDYRYGEVTCELTPPYPQPGWSPFNTDHYLTDDGRSVFTLSLINTRCLNTRGDFYLIIDGWEYHLSSQSDVLAHCGVTHQQTFIIDYANRTYEALPDSVCFNDGDCLAARAL